MKEKVINSQELTKNDLEEYYKQLEQAGKKVRILNELPEEKEKNDNSFHF